MPLVVELYLSYNSGISALCLVWQGRATQFPKWLEIIFLYYSLHFRVLKVLPAEFLKC